MPRFVKVSIWLFTVLFLLTGAGAGVVFVSVLQQADATEIRALLSDARIVEAHAQIQREQPEAGLLLTMWVHALAYAGFVDEAQTAGQALASATREPGVEIVVADGLLVGGRTDEALDMARAGGVDDADPWFATALARAGRIADARAQAGQIPNRAVREATYGELAMGLSRLGLLDEAAEIAREITARKPDVERELALALARAGRGEEALARVADPPTDDFTVTRLAEVLAANGDIPRALEAAGLAQNNQTRVAASIGILVKAGRADEALAAAQGIADPYYAAPALATVVPLLSAIGRTDGSRKLLEAALGLANRSPNRDGTVGAIVARLVDAGSLDDAILVVRESTARAGRPNGVRELAMALAGSGRTGDALALLPLADNERLRTAWRGAIAEAFGERAGRVGAAAALSDDRFNGSPEDLAALARGLARSGAPSEAVAAADRVQDPQARASARCRLAVDLATAKAYRLARLAAEDCDSAVGRWTAYLSMLETFALDRNPAVAAAMERRRAYRRD